MKRWLRWCAAGAAAATIAMATGGCAERHYADDATQPTLVLDGPSFTFTVGEQRFAIAVFGPPATLLLMRVGPEYVWVTPTPAIRDVYVQELVGDRPDSSHVLVANAAGSVDCVSALRWDAGATDSSRSPAAASR